MNVQDNGNTPADQTTDQVVNDQTSSQTTEDQTNDQLTDQTTEEQASTKDEKPRDENGRFKGVQPRIDELTRARREAEREAAYWRQVAQQQAQPSADAAPQKPARNAFENEDDYIEALTEWKAEQAVAKRLEQESTRKVLETRVQTHAERVAQAKQEIPDFDEVVGASETPIAKHVVELIQESDLGPKLMYHFAKNPQVLEQLNGLTERQATKEFGKLEVSLSVPKAENTALTKKVTQAPVPPNTSVSNQGRSSTQDIGKMSMEEYMAFRKAQGATWAR